MSYMKKIMASCKPSALKNGTKKATREVNPTRRDSIRLAHHKMHTDAKTQYTTHPFYAEARKEGEDIAKKFPSLNEYLNNPENRGKLGYDYEKPSSDVKPSVNKKKKGKKGPCWSGYEMIGMKKKGGRTVPNCVPKKK